MITILHGGGRVSRDPQKWLRNMCTTPYHHIPGLGVETWMNSWCKVWSLEPPRRLGASEWTLWTLVRTENNVWSQNECIPGNIATKKRIKLMFCMVKHSETMHVLRQYIWIYTRKYYGKKEDKTHAVHGETLWNNACFGTIWMYIRRKEEYSHERSAWWKGQPLSLWSSS